MFVSLQHNWIMDPFGSSSNGPQSQHRQVLKILKCLAHNYSMCNQIQMKTSLLQANEVLNSINLVLKWMRFQGTVQNTRGEAPVEDAGENTYLMNESTMPCNDVQ